MTQGLHFLVGREPPWVAQVQSACNVRYRGTGIVSETYRKIRNGKFRLKGPFRTVADNLNFAQAAEALYLTQPAVTLQIKALEEELGVPLLIAPKTESR